MAGTAAEAADEAAANTAVVAEPGAREELRGGWRVRATSAGCMGTTSEIARQEPPKNENFEICGDSVAVLNEICQICVSF